MGLFTIRVTISDVAKQAGVSRATAARILGGYAGPWSRAREQVLQAAQDLGYFPNNMAKSLASRRSYKIGVLLPDMENLFFAKIFRGIERVCEPEGFRVLLGITGENTDREQSLLAELLSDQVEGVIVAPAGGWLDPAAVHVPLVCVDRVPEDVVTPYNWVTTDNYQSAYAATCHLAEQGYERVAMITNLPHLSTIQARVAGVEAASTACGLSPQPSLVTKSHKLDEMVTEIVVWLRTVRPDAVVAMNAVICMAVITAARDIGLSIDTELGIVGYDDESWMPLVHPAITAIHQPAQEMGERTARILLDHIAAPGSPPVQMKLAGSLIVRESTHKTVRIQ